MRRISILFLVLFLVNQSCATHEKLLLPDLYDDVSSEIIDKQVFMAYTRESYRHRCVDTELDGVSYRICFNRENRMEYISTSDPGFISPENLRVGMPLASIEATLSVESFLLDDDHRYWWFKLPSGWCAAFALEDRAKPDESYPKSQSVISFFFKVGIYEFHKMNEISGGTVNSK